MKWVKYLVVAVVLLLSACATIEKSNMRIFILGKWIGKPSPDTGTQYILKFLPFNILLANIKNSSEEAHDVIFTYRFLAHDRIALKGRFLDELQITKRDNNLVNIYSSSGFIPNGEYNRDLFAYLYFLILLLAGILLLMIGRYLKRKKSRPNEKVSIN